MSWTSITMTNLGSIKAGTRVAPIDATDEPDYIYTVTHITDPDAGTFSLDSDYYNLKTIKTKEEFLKENWWADL